MSLNVLETKKPFPAHLVALDNPEYLVRQTDSHTIVYSHPMINRFNADEVDGITAMVEPARCGFLAKLEATKPNKGRDPIIIEQWSPSFIEAEHNLIEMIGEAERLCQ